jgi:hypothetical protein
LGEPKLQLSSDAEGRVFLETDSYARRVTLTATTAEGEWLHWDFEDNSFDLLPGHKKPVIWHGNHRHGTLRARCAGASQPVTLAIPQPE